MSIQLSMVQAVAIYDTLQHARIFFQNRDRTSSERRLGDVQWSQLTKLVSEQVALLLAELQRQGETIITPIQHAAHSPTRELMSDNTAEPVPPATERITP